MNCFLLCDCGHKLKTEMTITAVLKKMTGYCPEVDSPMPWGCQLQFLYISVDSHLGTYSFFQHGRVTWWLCGCGSTGKDEEGDKYDLNQCWVLLKCILCMKLWNHFFRCKAFASMTNRTLWYWNWCCCIWYIRLKLNSFQLQISLKKSNLLTHIDFLLACYFCRVKWKICTNNFHSFLCLWQISVITWNCHFGAFIFLFPWSLEKWQIEALLYNSNNGS